MNAKKIITLALTVVILNHSAQACPLVSKLSRKVVNSIKKNIHPHSVSPNYLKDGQTNCAEK